jgi:Na+:H+ antiporter, NhaA family
VIGSPPEPGLDRWETDGGAQAFPRSRANVNSECAYAALRGLPHELVDRLTQPFARFLRIESAAGFVLLLFVACAITLSNSPLADPFAAFWETPVALRLGAAEFSRSLKHWINEGLMTFFFFIVALELKREMVVGELQDARIAALSFAGALGGMIVPAGLYALLAGGGASAHGWGTVMATDTALLLGCLAVLGARVPLSLRLFLLSLAIFDDIGAIAVVAIGYGNAPAWQALALAVLGFVAVAALARIGVRSILLYTVAGAAIWVSLDVSGLHPTMAGVILGLMTPARGWVSDNRLHAILSRVVAYPPGDHWSGDTTARRDLQRAGIAAQETLSPVERLEILLHPWVAFAIMPLFALANAGVPIMPERFDGTLANAIFVGLVVGKPVGVVAFSYLSVRLGWASLPAGLSWDLLAAGSLLTGIGFTMAIFIADLAFDASLLHSAKLGILMASIVSGGAGLLVLAVLTSGTRRKAASLRSAKKVMT